MYWIYIYSGNIKVLSMVYPLWFVNHKLPFIFLIIQPNALYLLVCVTGTNLYSIVNLIFWIYRLVYVHACYENRREPKVRGY